MGQLPWGLRFLSKGGTTDLVCRKLHHAYLLEVGLMQIVANHEPL